MTDLSDSPVLAIDGGGTRCRLALVTKTGRQVVETGAANAFSDFNRAIDSVLDGLDQLRQQSGLDADAVYRLPAFVGLAGVISDDIARRLAKALPLKTARYAEDRVAALCGALGPNDGFLAHCGTGSFLAAQIGGVERFAGGWGAALGDEASAQWVGRRALNLALKSVDGFQEKTPLVDTLLSHLGGAEVVLRFASRASPKDYGALAPTITALDTDPVTQVILKEGASYLAQGLRHMGWTEGMAICLTGGIGPHYASFLPVPMRADLTDPKGTPLDGAIALAKEWAACR